MFSSNTDHDRKSSLEIWRSEDPRPRVGTLYAKKRQMKKFVKLLLKPCMYLMMHMWVGAQAEPDMNVFVRSFVRSFGCLFAVNWKKISQANKKIGGGQNRPMRTDERREFLSSRRREHRQPVNPNYQTKEGSTLEGPPPQAHPIPCKSRDISYQFTESGHFENNN